METLRQINRFATYVFRFSVGILLLVMLFMILLSLLVKPFWDEITLLFVITVVQAGYVLVYSKRLDNKFIRKIERKKSDSQGISL